MFSEFGKFDTRKTSITIDWSQYLAYFTSVNVKGCQVELVHMTMSNMYCTIQHFIHSSIFVHFYVSYRAWHDFLSWSAYKKKTGYSVTQRYGNLRRVTLAEAFVRFSWKLPCNKISRKKTWSKKNLDAVYKMATLTWQLLLDWIHMQGFVAFFIAFILVFLIKKI